MGVAVTARQPDWDLDSLDGKAAEAFVEILRAGIVNGTVEVKNDRRAPETGNVYVEFRCKGPHGWYDSGIRTTKARYWFFVLGDATGNPTAIAVSTERLRELSENARVANCRYGSHPTEGYLIGLEELTA